MTYGVSRFDDDGTYIEICVELFAIGELRFGAEPDKLCLILIQLKSSRWSPIFKVFDAKLLSSTMLWNCIKNHACEQLGVVCIEEMAYVEAVNRIRHVLSIDCQLLQFDPQALRNTKRQTDWPRDAIWRLECLRASGVVREKPLQLVMFDVEPISKYVDKHFVANSVKRRAKVQQHKS